MVYFRVKGNDMTITQRVITWARQGVDIEMMTMILRSEGVPDSDIRAEYDEVALTSSTEIVRGQYYIRLDRT